MKSMMVAIIALFISMTSNAAEIMSRCQFEYRISENNVVGPVFINKAGEFSIKDCMNEAAKAREVSLDSISFTYDVFTKITNDGKRAVNLDVKSEGWTLSGEILEKGILPSSLDFREFSNY